MNHPIKTTYENLYNIGFFTEPVLDLLQFGDKIGFFTMVGTQRTQNYGHELDPQQFKDAYQRHIDNPGINTKKLKAVDEGSLFYFLKHNEDKDVVYLYDVENELIHTRQLREVKKYDNAKMFKHKYQFQDLENFINNQ